MEGLHQAGAKVRSYIPNRFEEGYGINQKALGELIAQGVQLVVSVDCGVGSAKEIKWAKAQGLDVIVTDHHTPPEILPEAIPVLNPKVPGDQYPFKDLAGVGVAFKVIQALQQRLGKPAAGQEKWLLDLVALGTSCDMVALVGENRVLAKYGLLVMHKTRRAGLKALADVSGTNIAEVASYHLGFIFGPRLNAAGRIEHAQKSLQLMQAEQSEQAALLAQELNVLNTQRRADQERIFKAADEQALQYVDDPVLVLAADDWSHGVVGIVASKLVEKWHKPAIVMHILGASTKGSARSIGAFNLAEALAAQADLLQRFGGHHFAAGLTLKTSRLDEFRQAICAYYLELGIDPEAGEESLEPDVELDNFASLDWDLWTALQQLEPYGNGNPEPIFRLKNAKVVSVQRVGVDKKHLRLKLADQQGTIMPAIGFGQAERHPNLKEGQAVEVHFQLSKNDFQGRSDLQLMVAELH
jgi:single-stranded-DNA-specific exonuclease